MRVFAQSSVSEQSEPGLVPGTGTDVITLGNSAAELTGPWRFHIGDNLQWAMPEFDDSDWELVDLTPPKDSADPDLGTSGLLPGWTTTGHPDHSGYAWYRLRVRIDGNVSSTRLSLKMPDAFDDAYQVFVNGQPIGQFGHFGPRHVTAFTALPGGFKLPSDLRSGPITIAIRMWMDSATPYSSPDAGGMHGPPVLGHAQTVASQVRLAWEDVDHAVGVGFLEMLILLLALAVALTHFWMDRTDQAYLWLGLVAFVTLLGNVLVLLSSYTTVLSQDAYVIFSDVVVAPLRIGLWVLFWAYWFRLEPPTWVRRLVWALVVLLAAGTLPMRPPLHGTIISLQVAQMFGPFVLVTKLALAGLLLWVVLRGIRKRGTEGWVSLPAVFLAMMANYQHELRLIHIRIAFSVFGYNVSLGVASTMLSLLLVTVMLSRRFLLAERRKVQWGWEIEQARQVQQVLIPKEMPQVAGLRIEGDYRPAREVGGDFFQILPHADDGSVLLVVGDVTGKGLCAGMMVALIVGIVNTAAREDPDPVRTLRTLNERLCERDHATATCLALRIGRDGEVLLANAGHLPPYRNGQELAMEGALPLGVMTGAEFPVMRFRMEEGDSLMLISDGVAEAQGSDGVLFGFERIGEILRRPVTAAELATAAQRFGQEDDILVLRVEREPVRLETMAANRALVLG